MQEHYILWLVYLLVFFLPFVSNRIEQKEETTMKHFVSNSNLITWYSFKMSNLSLEAFCWI